MNALMAWHGTLHRAHVAFYRRPFGQTLCFSDVFYPLPSNASSSSRLKFHVGVIVSLLVVGRRHSPVSDNFPLTHIILGRMAIGKNRLSIATHRQ